MHALWLTEMIGQHLIVIKSIVKYSIIITWQANSWYFSKHSFVIEYMSCIKLNLPPSSSKRPLGDQNSTDSTSLYFYKPSCTFKHLPLSPSSILERPSATTDHSTASWHVGPWKWVRHRKPGTLIAVFTTSADGDGGEMRRKLWKPPHRSSKASIRVSACSVSDPFKRSHKSQ